MKHIYKLMLVLIVIAIVLTACGPQKPANKLEAVKQAGKIVVGTSADYPPFEFMNKDKNDFDGFDIMYIREIGKRMNLKVEIVDMPFDSLIAAVQEGKIDMAIAAFNYDEERDKKVDFTDFYYTTKDCFMVGEGSGITIKTKEDLAQYILAAQTGTTEDSWFKENMVDTKLVPEDKYFSYDRADQGALDVKSGRVQVMMADCNPAYALAKQLGGISVQETDIVQPPALGMVIPEGAKELAAELNKYIKAMQDDGTVTKFAEEYFK